MTPLLDIGQFEVPSNPLNVTKKYVQLLQVNEFVETKVIQCISVVKISEHEYIYGISREACKRLHIMGILQFNNYVMSGIKINCTTTHPIIYVGTIDNEGRYNGVAYSDSCGNIRTFESIA